MGKGDRGEGGKVGRVSELLGVSATATSITPAFHPILVRSLVLLSSTRPPAPAFPGRPLVARARPPLPRRPRALRGRGDREALVAVARPRRPPCRRQVCLCVCEIAKATPRRETRED